MSDYHQRFKAGVLGGRFNTKEGHPNADEILAFIDEVVAEERERLYNDPGSLVVRTLAQNKERTELIEKVEGMKPPEDPHSPYWLLGFARAKQTVLTYLRACTNDETYQERAERLHAQSRAAMDEMENEPRPEQQGEGGCCEQCGRGICVGCHQRKEV